MANRDAFEDQVKVVHFADWSFYPIDHGYFYVRCGNYGVGSEDEPTRELLVTKDRRGKYCVRQKAPRRNYWLRCGLRSEVEGSEEW
jgi:hypothetical protein